jgi:hypothetical protein
MADGSLDGGSERGLIGEPKDVSNYSDDSYFMP